MAGTSLTTDEEFAAVVARSRSWRQVLRECGSKTTGTTKVRLRVERLGLDTSHFTGQRIWTDDQLRAAVAEAVSWNEVAHRLQSKAAPAKRRAMRLGLDIGHLDRRAQSALRSLPSDMSPSLSRLRFAGESLAVAWFQLAGCTVAAVPGQAPYDLVVEFPGEGMKKVQVKTSQGFQASERMIGMRPKFNLVVFAYFSALERARLPYSDNEVDYFLLIAGMDDMWLVPHERVAGQTSCSPGPEYEEFRIQWPGKERP